MFLALLGHRLCHNYSTLPSSLKAALGNMKVIVPAGWTQIVIWYNFHMPWNIQFSSVAQSCPTLCYPEYSPSDFLKSFPKVQTLLISQAIKTQTVGGVGPRARAYWPLSHKEDSQPGEKLQEEAEYIPTQSLEWKMRGREAWICRI